MVLTYNYDEDRPGKGKSPESLQRGIWVRCRQGGRPESCRPALAGGPQGGIPGTKSVAGHLIPSTLQQIKLIQGQKRTNRKFFKLTLGK